MWLSLSDACFVNGQGMGATSARLAKARSRKKAKLRGLMRALSPADAAEVSGIASLFATKSFFITIASFVYGYEAMRVFLTSKVRRPTPWA